MEEVDLPKSRTAKTHRSSFSDEELDKLLRRIEGSDFELIFKLASWTGMRNGEILALQREDIDFDRKIICVRHNLAYVDHKVYMENPKTETSHRMIPISEEHLDEMRNWIESKEYKNRAAKACEINKDFANLVFLSRTGKPVKGAALSNCMRHVVEKMKKDGELDSRSVYTFHSLRHTFATRCLLKGMTPKVLSTLLGHSSTDITLRVYAHVNAEDERNEMERLGLL